VNEPFLRDTINVPYYDGNPNSVGDFVYHCHLLEHEDNGMMGLIRVEPAERPKTSAANARKQKTTVAGKFCGAPHAPYGGN
jgi:hypothetical protein